MISLFQEATFNSMLYKTREIINRIACVNNLK